ncbi:hypothetical protein A3H80_04515 [Candidatus Roizmanbacteria bacterium RIFCSPLOWO2_02_FULL_37_19]|nr:MAG: hypothetical protein A2862_01210 [Candidatus Roizmanbacteria bacterium RIFCSPHIGHO2_01_FULL_38_41]OGK33277.1 MAG: hypothetical protein A3E10_04710 [Candidatus Roizmanbacteria bacterium RIFCSPHIGHO2_12_FULL_37_23]OGK53694.1 MAG: hypothetical protein A3H80_04515 [Candidatus Roizmanbacteria bacterium RIFCSPLOWO2_02_FULL_37_19]
MKRIFTIVFVFFFSLVCFFSRIPPAYAQTYQVVYDFDFYLTQSKDIDVKLTITLTNLRPDLYINEFSLTFPSSFFSEKFIAKNELGVDIPYVITPYKNMTKVTFSFNEPESGRFSANSIILSYTHTNLHSFEGNISEVILPLVIPRENIQINATLHLPESFDKKISLSKPIPTRVDFNTLRWENVTENTIYALFGDSQIYNMKLSYDLVNDRITDSVVEIPFPPDTLYQKIYVNKLEPEPYKVKIDDDGNFIAQYKLGRHEKTTVKFEGFVEVFVHPRDEMRDYVEQSFVKQKKYLLSEQPYWNLGSFAQEEGIKALESPKNVYQYTTDTLSYAEERIGKNVQRFGASRILNTPHAAICMEYTDLFIAIAREKGIYTRELEGYGYSERQNIRPLSLVSDVLHAWPEYYDEQKNIWLPVDPTWQDTSGIDYFSGLDVNHIVFAIHGKNSDKPLPAGFYKTTDKQNVSVSISGSKPRDFLDMKLHTSIPGSISTGKTYKKSITVTNTGNVYMHDLNIIPTTKSIIFDSGPLHIDILAPRQSKEINVVFHAGDTQTTFDTINFSLNGKRLAAFPVKIESSRSAVLQYLIGGGIGLVIIICMYFIISRKPKSS